ncbi:MAG: SLC13 family permease [Eubacteriales bacterium]|nr:SLC13 family permease [Eubacteriales bacterium]
MTKTLNFLRKNAVLCIASAAALVTCFFVPPSREYLSYFDIRTLVCLFITLAVVAGLRNIRFFTILAKRIVLLTGNLRGLAVALVCITFIGSMLIANDMALITFLPLGYFALSVTRKERHMAYLFILQNISANLGGMLTPFGNPQNLYLYSAFRIPTGEFTQIMLPPFLLSVLLLISACFLLPAEKLEIGKEAIPKLNRPRAASLLFLFALSIAVVFRLLPWSVGFAVITVMLFFLDREALKAVDYPLLLTFVMFFIFSGNLSRISAVNRFFSSLLEKDTFLTAVLSCQCISNVPTAILLSRFTENYRALLLGVNIGGTGTLIASLASLITFREYRLLHPGDGKHYFVLFTLINLIFLFLLSCFARFFLLR